MTTRVTTRREVDSNNPRGCPYTCSRRLELDSCLLHIKFCLRTIYPGSLSTTWRTRLSFSSFSFPSLPDSLHSGSSVWHPRQDRSCNWSNGLRYWSRIVDELFTYWRTLRKLDNWHYRGSYRSKCESLTIPLLVVFTRTSLWDSWFLPSA